MTDRRGTVLTFYSYKGGTGRSLALANVAWILASNGKKVLAIDWDLEAPGLHRYFHPFLIDAELADTPGLIDFFWVYSLRLMTPFPDGESRETWPEEASDVADYAVRLDWKFDKGGILDFIPAGRQNEDYGHRITSFDWNNFYSRLDGEALLARIRARLKTSYDFVLIDSRTGVSDTAGICTIAMPDRLVAMFTLNTQSLEGVSAVLRSVLDNRENDGPEVYPVITRVELAEKERLETARRRARAMFGDYTRSKDGGPRGYWSDAEVLYHPYYAYEEVLATFADKTGRDYSESSLVAAMLRLSRRVAEDEDLSLPEIDDEQREEILLRFTRNVRPKAEGREIAESVEKRNERAERYFGQYRPSPVEEAARRAHQARQIQLSSTVLGISAGVALAILPIGLVPLGSPWGLTSLIAGAAIALTKMSELSLGRPHLTAEWVDGGSAAATGTLRLWVSGRPLRRLFSSGIVAAALVACGASLMIWDDPDRNANLQLFGTLATGLIVMLVQAMMEALQVFEGWVVNDWRVNELERERRSYVNGVSPYDREASASFRLLVHKVEQIVAVTPRSIIQRPDAQNGNGEQA